jgi:hypothetical protein
VGISATGGPRRRPGRPRSELVEHIGALVVELEVSSRDSESADEVQVPALAFPL